MKFGITLTLTACVLSIVAVGICAVAWQQWTAAKRNTEDLTIRNAGLVIGQIDSYLDQFLDPAAQYVGRMAETAVPNGWHLEDTRIPNDILAASVAAAPEIITAGMLFNTGKDAQYVSKDGDSAHYLNDRSGDAYYESFRELRAMAKNPSWVEPAYDQVLETSSVRVWHAIRAGGQYFGAWYAGVSLAAVSEAVTEVGERFDGTAFVIHGDKHVLAHPNLMSQHPEPKDGEPTVSVGRVGDLILDGIWKDADAVRESDDASGNLQTIYSTLDGQDYVGFFRRIYRYGGAPWTIGVWFEAADVGLYRERLITAAWAGVGIILLALIMAVLASRAIARPIRRTATAVSAVGDGDISAAGFMPPSRITELNDLANSFNAMRSAVKMFETYVPRSLVRRLMSRDETLVASSERQLTVMFTDIVGFTTMAEGRSATEVADMVNEHFQILGACVEEHGGMLLRHGHGRCPRTRQPSAPGRGPTGGARSDRHSHGPRAGRQYRCHRAGQLHDHRRHGEHLSADREFGPRDRQFKDRDHSDQRHGCQTHPVLHALYARRQLYRERPRRKRRGLPVDDVAAAERRPPKPARPSPTVRPSLRVNDHINRPGGQISSPQKSARSKDCAIGWGPR